jgi:hypothetical protein
MRTVVIVLFVVGVVGAGVMLLAGLLIPRDTRTAELRDAPGFELGLPDAEPLWDHESASRGGSGATRTRAWGVHVSDEAVAAHFDQELTALGYERVAGRSYDPVGRSFTLGVYELGDVWFSVEVVRLPVRVPGGHVLRTGYEGVVYTNISNAPQRPPSST